jgi:hypothetical protein
LARTSAPTGSRAHLSSPAFAQALRPLTLLPWRLALGLTRPWTWSAMVLTRPVLAVGAPWFLVRGEWRRFAVAAAATVAIALVSLALDPHAWVASLCDPDRGGRPDDPSRAAEVAR